MYVRATITADARGVDVLRPLAGTPLLVRAVRSVLDAQVCERVTLDVSADPSAVLRACAGLPVDVAQVGARRSVGAHTGKRTTGRVGSIPDDGILLVHDARRALASSSLVAAVVAAVCDGHAGAFPVLPLTDTVKRVDAHGTVRATPDRESLRVAQTPFAWRGPDGPPDRAHGVPGEPRAFAVRTEWDLRLAELLVEDA